MQKMVAEIKSATEQGVSSKQNRYEYDSDEETEGGTWEHKARTKEMRTTEGMSYCIARVCVKHVSSCLLWIVSEWDILIHV